MNKTKFFAFIALAAILSACGSDDGSPPELVSNHSGAISPFDTLVVKFKSDLIEYNESSIDPGLRVKQVGKTTGKELRFIGTNETEGKSKLYYFDGGINDSIVFKKLKNADGYIMKDSTVFYFSTLRILDIEPNSAEGVATEIEGKIEEGITFAGILAQNIGSTESGVTYDNSDYYKLKLKARDTLNITITNREPLKISVKGPVKDIIDTVFQAAKGKSNVFRYIASDKYLYSDPPITTNTNELVEFKINIHDDPRDIPNPYKISVKVARR